MRVVEQHFGRLLSRRFHCIVALGLAFAVVAGGRGDWDVFVDAGRRMASESGLSVFADLSDVQTGPLSLAMSAALSFTARNGFVACVLLSLMFGLMALRLVVPVTSSYREQLRMECVTLVGGVLLMFWWTKLGGYGHLDDAAVLFAAAAALRLNRDRCTWWAAVLLGSAVAVKPWAVMFAPLAVAPEGLRWQNLKFLAAAGATASAGWAPFVLGDRSTLDSIRPTVRTAEDSVVHLLGLAGESASSSLRLGQLAGSFAVALVLVWRRRPDAVILGAVATRLALDPGTWGYYTAGILLGAVVWDLNVGRSNLPRLTIVMSVLLAPTWAVESTDARATMRLVACVVAVTVAMWHRPSASDGPSARPEALAPALAIG